VRETAKHRVDPAETLYNDLYTFFKRGARMGEEPTARKTITDTKALLHGKKDGKIVIENVKPHLTGGKHKIIDETFKDSAQFKDRLKAIYRSKKRNLPIFLP
jgi:hypothetical protein